MTFYENLAPYYDRIFPANEATSSFLQSYFKQGQSILDMGAGTGNMAITLTLKGYNVIAVEPDGTMAEYIEQKAIARDVTVPVYKKGMLDINQVDGPIEGMYCIGNTLPHLQDSKEIEDFIQKSYEIVENRGYLILQLVNYDKVLTTNNFSFPVIEKEEITFTREYKKEADKILFSTNLKVKDDTYTSSTTLYPITSDSLLSILRKIGFQVDDVFGNFKKQDFTRDSPALIVVAKKA